MRPSKRAGGQPYRLASAVPRSPTSAKVSDFFMNFSCCPGILSAIQATLRLSPPGLHRRTGNILCPPGTNGFVLHGLEECVDAMVCFRARPRDRLAGIESDRRCWNGSEGERAGRQSEYAGEAAD